MFAAKTMRKMKRRTATTCCGTTPDAFNPDRFNDPRAIDRFACPPFCEGPRICIEASMAQQEAGSG
jgi:cytochrome P450